MLLVYMCHNVSTHIPTSFIIFEKRIDLEYTPGGIVKPIDIST